MAIHQMRKPSFECRGSGTCTPPEQTVEDNSQEQVVEDVSENTSESLQSVNASSDPVGVFDSIAVDDSEVISSDNEDRGGAGDAEGSN